MLSHLFFVVVFVEVSFLKLEKITLLVALLVDFNEFFEEFQQALRSSAAGLLLLLLTCQCFLSSKAELLAGKVHVLHEHVVLDLLVAFLLLLGLLIKREWYRLEFVVLSHAASLLDRGIKP